MPVGLTRSFRMSSSDRRPVEAYLALTCWLLALYTTSAQDDACVVEQFVDPDPSAVVYVYHGTISLDMTWSDDYLDPADQDYQQLFDVVYTALYEVLACQLAETKDSFEGVTNITFSEGSVKVDWDLVLNNPLSDPDAISSAVAEELNQTEDFPYAVVDPTLDAAVQNNINTAFAIIGGLTGMIGVIGILYGLFKKVKFSPFKSASDKMKASLSKLPSVPRPDTIIQPTQSADSTATNPAATVAASQETSVAPQGWFLSKTYVMPGSPTFQPTPNYNTVEPINRETGVASQGYIMSQTYVMAGSPTFNPDAYGTTDPVIPDNRQYGAANDGYILSEPSGMPGGPTVISSDVDATATNHGSNEVPHGYMLSKTYVMPGSPTFTPIANYNIV